MIMIVFNGNGKPRWLTLLVREGYDTGVLDIAFPGMCTRR